MTIEAAKEAIKVMQAFVDGKEIEYSFKGLKGWIPLHNSTLAFDFISRNYRIAPKQEEPKVRHYRPYTMEEFVQEMHKHDGFVKIKDSTGYGSLITFIDVDIIISINRFSYQELLDDFVWSDDGTPCGKEV